MIAEAESILDIAKMNATPGAGVLPVPTQATVPAPTKRRSLFEIAAEYQAVVSKFEDSCDDGEIPESLETDLDAISGEMSEKLEGCFKALRYFETQYAAASEELDRLKMLVSVRENRVKWFKNYILQTMLACGMKKFEGATCTLRVQKNSRPSVTLANGAEIPAEFKREKTVVEFDSAKAYEQWKQFQALRAKTEKTDDPKELADIAIEMAKFVLPAEIHVVEGMHLRTQ